MLSHSNSHQQQHAHHLPHLPGSSPKKDPQLAQQKQNVIYLSIALMGGMILVTKPVLMLAVLLLMGYGRLYHVQTSGAAGGSGGHLFSRHQDNHSDFALHLGPEQRNHGHREKRANGSGSGLQLQDLARGLNFSGRK